MHLLIISGRSGSGKTVSLNVLEDLGYYCIDNLPIHLLPTLSQEFLSQNPKMAVSIDSRNLPADKEMLHEVLNKLKQLNLRFEIIYLDAASDVLLKRFSETRRRHPLTNNQTVLQEAIALEHTLLKPLAQIATTHLETTHWSKHQLCLTIKEKVAHFEGKNLQLLIQSFGFKNGMPTDSDFLFDVRCLPNPYWEPSLRNHSGLDPQVANFLSKHSLVQIMVEDVVGFLDNWIPHFEADNRSYLSVSIGCTGGQHRSVFVAQQVVERASHLNYHVQVRHRDL